MLVPKCTSNAAPLSGESFCKDDMDPHKPVPAYFKKSSQSRNLEATAAVNVMEIASYGNIA